MKDMMSYYQVIFFFYGYMQLLLAKLQRKTHAALKHTFIISLHNSGHPVKLYLSMTTDGLLVKFA